MIRSSLVKSACVAIALLGFSAPQAGAIELQGSNPSAQLSEGMISKAYIAHRGVTRVGPRGGVYHRGATVGGYRGGAYRGGGVYRGAGVYRGGYGGWARPSWYRWGAGGAIAAGAAIGVLATGAAIAYAGQPPAPGLCWYYTDPSYREGVGDACQSTFGFFAVHRPWAARSLPPRAGGQLRRVMRVRLLESHRG